MTEKIQHSLSGTFEQHLVMKTDADTIAKVTEAYGKLQERHEALQNEQTRAMNRVLYG